MTEQTVTTRTCDWRDCDVPNRIITDGEKYADFGEYGKHFHLDCVPKMSGAAMVAALDISGKVMYAEDWDGAEKAARFFRHYNR